MEASTFQYPKAFYDFDVPEVIESKITLSIGEIVKSYSPDFAKFIAMMLDVNEASRANLDELNKFLLTKFKNIYTSVELYSYIS